MTHQSAVSTKALNAFLVSRHKSLSAVVSMVGGDQEAIAGDTVTDDLLGKVARFLNLSVADLTAKAAKFATPPPDVAA